MAKQFIDTLSRDQHKKVENQLVSVFKTEQPPADYVEVVPDSLRPVDAKFKLYKALVRTDVYCNGVKQHISNIRLKLDKGNNVIANSITFN
jgi:hypothetical protein